MKLIQTLLLNLNSAIAANMHYEQIFAQTQASVGFGYPLSKYACLEDGIEDPQECIDFTIEGYELPYFFDGSYEDFNWKFDGQADCWLKFSDKYHLMVSDWLNDPLALDNGGISLFQMPDDETYEYFYNDPKCNQTWLMGRGGSQPDSITFYDVSEHDYNKLLFENRLQITPWISEDVLAIQMLGITERFIELAPEKKPDKGQGLVEGQFRIEYWGNKDGDFTQTKYVEITSDDFGCSTSDCPWNTPVPSPDGILENDVCIGRTPHYLTICKDGFCNQCSKGCEYFPAYTSTDESLSNSLNDRGAYDVDCSAGSTFTFYGLDWTDEPSTPKLTFNNKCETDAFVHAGGQTIELVGNIKGQMEVLIDRTVNGGLSEIFHLYPDGDLSAEPTIVKFSDILSGLPDNSAQDQSRAWITYQNGVFTACRGECSNLPLQTNCWSTGVVTATNGDDEIFYPSNNDAAYQYGLEGDDWIETGAGDDGIFGGEGDDYVDSISGRDLFTGGVGNDILVSRQGEDRLYGSDGSEQPLLENNTYRIYPTHEKDHHFGFFDDELGCTTIVGMDEDDTIEFRLDDPDYEHFQFTNDDDSCTVSVDGWELLKFWFEQLEEDDIEYLDVWFSRGEQRGYICLKDGMECSAGEFNDGADCYSVWVKCHDLDLEWIDDLEDEDKKTNVVLDTYTSDLNTLQWYGWW